MNQIEIMKLLNEIIVLFPYSKYNYKSETELDQALEIFERVLDGVTYDQAVEQLYRYVKSKPKYDPKITDLIPDPDEKANSADSTIPNLEQTNLLLERYRNEHEERRRKESEPEKEELRREFIQRARSLAGNDKRNRKIVIDLGLDESRSDR